ncbi:MAG TPA: DNA-processing protein DprA [Tepidisphaeraceae bacterium]|jgi:DNA processing protein|nr:DNA-processing protein DprA [Tepidisphaeraceae bacterium]
MPEQHPSLRYWLQLSLTPGIGPILTRRIIAAAGSAAAACTANANLLESVEGIGKNGARKIATGLRSAESLVDPEIQRVGKIGCRLICPEDGEYPILLNSIPDPPSVLYVMGALEPRDLHAVAIVGSRRCSFYGREQAERFGALLAGSGITVISGGARGIDSAAHRGALAANGGRTIAIIGSGIDIPYPPENVEFFATIAQHGAVVSEYPLGTPPNKENFPRRNRIVSGMSRGVLVVEADERSGALITARQAADDHNRPVFAVPGRVDNPLSTGTHQLIRDGAVLAAKLEDILDNLGPLPAEVTDAPILSTGQPPAELAQATPAERGANGEIPEIPLTESQVTLLAALDADAAAVDTIIERCGLPAHVVFQELTFLTLKGRVRRIDGQTYARRGKA